MLRGTDYVRDRLWLCKLADQCDSLYQRSGRLAAVECARQSVSVDTLRRALKTSHAAIRRRAVYIASLMPPEAAIDCLSDVLIGDECPVVRHEAAFCLGALGDQRSIDFLTEAMLHDPDTL